MAPEKYICALHIYVCICALIIHPIETHAELGQNSLYLVSSTFCHILGLTCL